jgi:hypothetical protein
MKSAIYIEDGRVQLVLTPQNETDKAVLATLEGKWILKVHRGSFYACAGGWTRHEPSHPKSDDDSLILIVRVDDSVELESG